jgi:hypothetical protein
MSELHAQIQDACNEFGVQIMSPHFESQPEKKIIVPKTNWRAALATAPGVRRDQPQVDKRTRFTAARRMTL